MENTKNRSHILIRIDKDVGVRSQYVKGQIMHFFLQNHQHFLKYSTYKEQVNTEPLHLREREGETMEYKQLQKNNSYL